MASASSGTAGRICTLSGRCFMFVGRLHAEIGCLQDTPRSRIFAPLQLSSSGIFNERYFMEDTATNSAIAQLKPQLNELGEGGLLRYGKMLIDGEWVDAASGETFDAIYPGNGEVIAKV